MDPRKIGHLIQTRRKEKRLTQTELAELLGVTDKAVSRWETGEGFPEITMLPKLSIILGISVDELLTGEAKINTYVEPKGNKSFISMMTGISSLVMLVGSIISVLVAYLIGTSVWPFIITLVTTVTGLIIYIISRHKYLSKTEYNDESKKILFKLTELIIGVCIISIVLYAPILIYYFEYTNQPVFKLDVIVSFKHYIQAEFYTLLISIVIWCIMFFIHYVAVYGLKSLSKYYVNVKSNIVISLTMILIGLFSMIGGANYLYVNAVILVLSIILFVKKKLDLYVFITVIVNALHGFLQIVLKLPNVIYSPFVFIVLILSIIVTIRQLIKSTKFVIAITFTTMAAGFYMGMEAMALGGNQLMSGLATIYAITYIITGLILVWLPKLNKNELEEKIVV